MKARHVMLKDRIGQYDQHVERYWAYQIVRPHTFHILDHLVESPRQPAIESAVLSTNAYRGVSAVMWKER